MGGNPWQIPERAPAAPAVYQPPAACTPVGCANLSRAANAAAGPRQSAYSTATPVASTGWPP